MNKVQGIIFDWAGTTVDYGCFAPLDVFIEIFQKANIKVTTEEVRIPMGLPKKAHIQALLLMPRILEQWKAQYGAQPNENDIDALYACFEKQLLDILPRYSEVIEDVLMTVEELRARKIKIGSTTGYSRKMMDILAPITERNGYAPDCIVTPEDVGCGRPEPFMCYLNAVRLQIPLGSLVKVGDTVSDIREGKNAGVISVGVVYGSSELGLTREEVACMGKEELMERAEKVRDRFRQAGADFIIDTMRELTDVIDTIESALHKEVS